MHTLHMPFEWRSEKENQLIEKLRSFAQTQNSFSIELRNFGSFPPRVIFIQVAENKELQTLQASLTKFCQAELNLFNANRLDQPFHAHLTVAFRDLKKSVFPKAWEFVKDLNFEERFPCRDLILLKHTGKSWQSFQKFALGDGAG